MVLGSAPWIRDYDRIWNGFLAAARADKWKIEVLYEDPSLKPIKSFEGLKRQTLSWPEVTPKLASEIKTHLQFGRLVVIHTTFNHSSYRNEDSLTSELERALKRPWTALSMLSFAVDEAELEQIQPPCTDQVAPATRGEYVACAAAKISRRNLRKKLDPAKNWLASERHGLGDYFIFVHQENKDEPIETIENQ